VRSMLRIARAAAARVNNAQGLARGMAPTRGVHRGLGEDAVKALAPFVENKVRAHLHPVRAVRGTTPSSPCGPCCRMAHRAGPRAPGVRWAIIPADDGGSPTAGQARGRRGVSVAQRLHPHRHTACRRAAGSLLANPKPQRCPLCMS